MPIGILPYELQNSLDSSQLRDSDKALRDALGEIFSNRNLGLNVRSISATDTLTEFDAVVLVSGSSGFTVTLPYAATWSSIDVNKTPILTIIHTGGAGVVTIAAQSTDTINGAASITLTQGQIATLINDGDLFWFRIGAVRQLTYEVFTASGTFTWPTGIDECEVFIQAAGGGSGGGAASVVAARQAGGGGAGEAVVWELLYRGSNTTETVTIGAPGTAGAGSGVGVNGGNGGNASDSSVRNIVARGGLGSTGGLAASANSAGANGSSQPEATGGGGGAIGAAGTAGSQRGNRYGGNGGNGGGATAKQPGSVGGAESPAAGTTTSGGGGGSSYLGTGGVGGTASGINGAGPVAPNGYGAGAGGGSGTANVGGSSGNVGGPAIILIRYYV